MTKDFDITKTKLIIWDLDDTFWDGTLSEGKITFNKDNLTLLENLVAKGIMNSICSKNDYLKAKTEFLLHGYIKYWQLFVFPSINWLAKGQRVKNIIESMQLREENVIFIDDNPANINEAKFYCPEIMTATPEQIKKISNELYLVNDYDLDYLRLKSYKVLETKSKDKQLQNCSNEEFLRKSEIKVCIKDDCEENIDRIDKLIHRTNQLNFTKKRIDKEDLKKIFAEKDKYDSKYIIAEDKYGNYGICGFYTINKEQNELEHFLFSCRIMNMGIEQFIYNKYLGAPNIEVAFPVSSNLNKNTDWIEVVDNIEIQQKKENNTNNFNILFKGACDLYSTISYIGGDCNIDSEFPYWNRQLIYISSHTHLAFIEQTNRLSEDELMSLTQTFPNPHPDEFKTEFFNPKYNVIVLSLLQTAYRGIYINKNNGHYAEYGFTNCDITNEKNWDYVLSKIPEALKEKNKEVLEDFKKDYVFAGSPPVELTLNNLKYIREHLNPNTLLILILPSEKDTTKCIEGYEGICEKHILLNKHVRDFVQQYNNIELLEITDLIQSDDDYTECINHFSRRIYAEIAEKIINIVNKRLDKNYLYFKADANPMTLCNQDNPVVILAN